MTRYTVQYIMPVDNPVSNVSMRRGRGFIEFLVPLNYPDAHKMNLSDLIAASELSGLVHLSTGHNKKNVLDKKKQ